MKRFLNLSGWLLLLGAGVPVFGQSNVQAVDSLKKEVAKVIFAELEGPNAKKIAANLAACGRGCNPDAVIQQVGGWPTVVKKLAFFDKLKGDKTFAALAPGDAVKTLSNQLTTFYNTHSQDNIYKRALATDTRQAIIGKMNRLLPGGEGTETAEAGAATDAGAEPDDLTESNTAGLTDTTGVVEAETERTISEDTPKPPSTASWLMLLYGGIAGLLLSAALFYAVFVRAWQNERSYLTQENTRLSKMVDDLKNLKQEKPAGNQPNEPRKELSNQIITLPDNVQRQLAQLEQIRAEVGAEGDLLTAIRQLKGSASMVSPLIGAVGATVAPTAPGAAAPVTPPEPSRVETFYFPPPDTLGYFDNLQKSQQPTPDSGYKLQVDAHRPDRAAFGFETEPGRVKRFLTYRTYFIDPACETENNYQEELHTRIQTVENGEAVLENGTWRVLTKAVVRFE